MSQLRQMMQRYRTGKFEWPDTRESYLSDVCGRIMDDCRLSFALLRTPDVRAEYVNECFLAAHRSVEARLSENIKAFYRMFSFTP